MVKTSTVKLLGEELTLALTVDAFRAIHDKYGGIAQMFRALKINIGDDDDSTAENTPKTPLPNFSDALELAENTAWLLSVLLAGGREYALLTEGKREREFTEKELRTICAISETVRYRDAVLAAVFAGLSREVEVEDDPKNAETTQNDR